MKYFFQFLLFTLILFTFSATVKLVYADNLCPAGFTSLCNIDPSKNNGAIGGIGTTIVVTILIVSILASLFFIVLGAIRWITSGGEQAKVASARSTILAALIGLVIALLAFFIVSYLLYFFTGQGLGSFQLPRLF